MITVLTYMHHYSHHVPKGARVLLRISNTSVQGTMQKQVFTLIPYDVCDLHIAVTMEHTTKFIITKPALWKHALSENYIPLETIQMSRFN
jgi:hypothetical protein